MKLAVNLYSHPKVLIVFKGMPYSLPISALANSSPPLQIVQDRGVLVKRLERELQAFVVK